ncbi:MAG: NINE protein [Bacteroides eggerthii]
MKSKSTAAVLAIIFGEWGIHHFYLGNTAKGFCYLIIWSLFCWTFVIPVILAIIALIEGIVLACKSQEDFNMEYNSNNYTQTYFNATAHKEPQKSQTEQLLDLKKLYDAGVLTEGEFNEQKTKILNS